MCISCFPQGPGAHRLAECAIPVHWPARVPHTACRADSRSLTAILLQTGKLCRLVAVNATQQIKCDVTDLALAATFGYNGSSFSHMGRPLTNPGASKNYTLHIGGQGTPTSVTPAGECGGP
jgi:hypothetical protein